MTPLTEIIIFPPFRRGEEATHESFNVFNKAGGLLRAFKGFQAEDPTIRYWILEWQSAEHQQKFVADASTKRFMNTLRTNLEEAQVIQIEAPCPVEACAAPITEMTMGTWLPGVDKHTAFAGVQLTVNDADTDPRGPLPGSVGIPWLWSVDRTSQFVYAHGWESVEAHNKAMETPVGAARLREMGALSNFDIRHVELERHEIQEHR